MKLINLEATRAAYAPFETIDQLNANTRAIRATHWEMLIKSEKEVLDVLHRFATKHYGVCYLSKSSIAEKVGMSRRQIIRICKRFEDMGIIVQYETNRKRCGGRTSNTIVFLTQISARDAFVNECEQVTDNMHDDNGNGEICEDAVVSSVDTDNVTSADTNLDAPKDAPKELKDLKITRDTEASAALNKQGLVRKLPETLQHLFAPFFDASEIYELAGVVFKAKASVDKSIKIEKYSSEFYEVILKAINGFNRGQVKSLPAVLYSAVSDVTRKIVNANRCDLFRSTLGF